MAEIRVKITRCRRSIAPDVVIGILKKDLLFLNVGNTTFLSWPYLLIAFRVCVVLHVYTTITLTS